MNANPAQFEAIGTRLGFRVVEQTPDRVRLLWRGPRFPAFLCLGIALLLLFISVPIVEAIRIRGFVGPAGSLWYFPLMNLILFGIAFFLLTQRRTIEIDPGAGLLSLRRQSLYRSVGFAAAGSEIAGVTLGIDRVYSGFALGGSTAAERFPVPALRLELSSGENLLLDRGSARKLTELGRIISEGIAKPLAIEPELLAAHRSSMQIPKGTTVGAELRKPITNAAQRTKRPFAKRKPGRSPNKGKQKNPRRRPRPGH